MCEGSRAALLIEQLKNIAIGRSLPSMKHSPTCHEVSSSPKLVGIECDNCGQRIVVEARDLGVAKGDYRPLEAALRCRVCGERGRSSAVLFDELFEAQNFAGPS